MKLEMHTENLTLLRNCSLQIFSAATGQVYGIWKHPDGTRFVVARKLPIGEYLDYYRDRRDELYLDRQLNYWLPLHHCSCTMEAKQYLNTIGDLR